MIAYVQFIAEVTQEDKDKVFDILKQEFPGLEIVDAIGTTHVPGIVYCRPDESFDTSEVLNRFADLIWGAVDQERVGHVYIIHMGRNGIPPIMRSAQALAA